MHLAILKILLELASLTAKYLHDKRLMDAGKAQAIIESLEHANNQIRAANDARNHVDSLPMSKDENNRDNR